jgi:hypothetical protein
MSIHDILVEQHWNRIEFQFAGQVCCWICMSIVTAALHCTVIIVITYLVFVMHSWWDRLNFNTDDVMLTVTPVSPRMHTKTKSLICQLRVMNVVSRYKRAPPALTLITDWTIDFVWEKYLSYCHITSWSTEEPNWTMKAVPYRYASHILRFNGADEANV